ncbi:hypothetical protein VPH35_081287 [Triticum aestivum]
MASEALVVLARVRSGGKTPSLSPLATLLRLLFGEGNVQAAWKVFVEMTAMGPRSSLAVFNVMVLRLCRRGSGLFPVAAGLLGVMWRFHVIPDACSYDILIKNYCVFGRAGDAFQLFDKMHRAGDTFRLFDKMHKPGCEPAVVTYNILLNSRRPFDETAAVGIEANTITFIVLVDGYAKAGQMDEADAACREMKARGLLPDCCTFNILSAGAYKLRKVVHLTHEQQELYIWIYSLCWDGRLDDVRQLVCSAVEQGVPVSVAGFNALIAAYSEVRFEEEALELYRLMKEIGLAPLSPTLNYLILGLCNQGRLDDAQLLLDHMISKGFLSGNVKGALKCWDDMVKVGVQPGFIAFSAYTSGLCRSDHVNEAYRAFVEMRRLDMVNNHFLDMRSSGLTPDVVTYNTIVIGYCRAQAKNGAMIFMNKMPADGCDPDILTYNIWIRSLCNNHSMNRAMRVLDELVAVGSMILTDKLIKMAFQPNTITVNVFFSHFCKQGLGRWVLVWAEKLREDCVALDDATLNILDWASKEMEYNPQDSIADIGKCMFLEFLMLITYTTMSNSRSPKFTHVPTETLVDPAGSSTIKVLDTG